MQTSSVPVHSLDESETCGKRFQNLKAFFKNAFQADPKVFVRAPGRVNLIGEHIDYCGYSVLPMALEQDILLAVGKSEKEGIFRFANVDEKYSTYMNAFEGEIQIDKNNIDWWCYILCGIKGIVEHHSVEVLSLDVACSGNIPPQAGLSSSSALVCAAAIAISYMEKLEISKHDLASLCAKSERHVGTEGGGMDQAISMLASQGTAKLIDFNPLSTTEVLLPNEAVFVIAHSLVEKNKAASSDFNNRVVECRLAAQVLAKSQNLNNWRDLKKLADVQQELKLTFSDIIALCKNIIHSGLYSKQELLLELGVSEEEFKLTCLTDNTQNIESFNLLPRALHVFSEAQRVQDFKLLCDGSCSSETLSSLGSLMYESHMSCKDLYECSHPNLDEIVELSKGIAYGARMTGAGWGGCTIAIVGKTNVTKYCDKLKDEFYSKNNVPEDSVGRYLFVTSPGRGAHLILD